MFIAVPDSPDRRLPGRVSKGRCGWCQQRGDSKEDIFSRWFDNDVLQNRGPNAVATLTRQTDHRNKTYSLSRIATKLTSVRGTCEDCNNGWMSQMEKEVRPVLAPLMNGHARTLLEPDQLKIATWVAMKSIALDCDYRNDPAGLTSLYDRDTVRLAQRPPENWLVLIGSYNQEGRFRHACPYKTWTTEEGMLSAQFLGTFLLNHVVLQVLGRTGSQLKQSLELKPGGIHDRTRASIWPPRPDKLLWPLPEVMDTEMYNESLTNVVPNLKTPASVLADELPAELCDTCRQVHKPPEFDLPRPEISS